MWKEATGSDFSAAMEIEGTDVHMWMAENDTVLWRQ